MGVWAFYDGLVDDRLYLWDDPMTTFGQIPMKITIRGILVVIVLVTVFMGATAHCQTVHGITLTWTQSPSPGITLNTVYSSPTVTGVYTKLFSSTAPITAYFIALTAVNGGTNQCFEVTATTTIESAPSAPVCSTFPVPPASPSGLSASPN